MLMVTSYTLRLVNADGINKTDIERATQFAQRILTHICTSPALLEQIMTDDDYIRSNPEHGPNQPVSAWQHIRNTLNAAARLELGYWLPESSVWTIEFTREHV